MPTAKKPDLRPVPAADEQPELTKRRRDQIVRAAVRLFSDRGYFPTTIEDIANEVHISKGLIYRYFKDKNDLLLYALRFVLDHFGADVNPTLRRMQDPLSALRAAFHTYCQLVDEYRLETEFAYRATRDLPRKDRLQIKVQETKIWRTFRNCLEACVHRGLMVPVNLDIMAYQYITYAHQWALKHWAFRDKYSFEEYLADGEFILIDILLTEEGRRTNKVPSKT